MPQLLRNTARQGTHRQLCPAARPLRLQCTAPTATARAATDETTSSAPSRSAGLHGPGASAASSAEVSGPVQTRCPPQQDQPPVLSSSSPPPLCCVDGPSRDVLLAAAHFRSVASSTSIRGFVDHTLQVWTLSERIRRPRASSKGSRGSRKMGQTHEAGFGMPQGTRGCTRMSCPVLLTADPSTCLVHSRHSDAVPSSKNIICRPQPRRTVRQKPHQL